MFGAQYPATKAAVANMGPILLSVLTYLLASLCLLPFLMLENRVHPEQSPPLAVFDKLNFVPFFMATILGFFPASVILAWGIDRSLASNAALLTLSIPIFTAVLASIVRDERMTIWRWMSFVLGIGGAVICSDIDWKNLNVFSARYLLGNFLILAGCSGSAFTNVYSKNLLARFRPVRLLVLSYAFTGLFCLPFLWLFEPVTWNTLSSYPLRTWLGLGNPGLILLGARHGTPVLASFSAGSDAGLDLLLFDFVLWCSPGGTVPPRDDFSLHHCRRRTCYRRNNDRLVFRSIVGVCFGHWNSIA